MPHRSQPVVVQFRHAVPADAVTRTLQKLLGNEPGEGRIYLVVERDIVGPGGELMRLLHRLGFRATAGCKCLQRASTMDRNGCDWCEANIPTIVGWLREEATKRGLPFVDVAGTVLVRRAISNARRLHRGKA
jgi:hypothetical protein